MLFNKIYEKVLHDVIESKEIGPTLYDNYEQLEDYNKDRLHVMLKKYSIIKKD